MKSIQQPQITDDFLECIIGDGGELAPSTREKKCVEGDTVDSPRVTSRSWSRWRRTMPSLWARSEDSSGVGHIPAGRPPHSATNRSGSSSQRIPEQTPCHHDIPDAALS